MVLMRISFLFNSARKGRSLTFIQGCLSAIFGFILLMTILAYHLNLVYRVRIAEESYELLDHAAPNLHTPTCLLGDLQTARQLPVLRVVVVYFSISQKDTYFDQIKWSMRSLLEVAETEPPLWRTDLMIYIENTTLPELIDLGCSMTPRQNVLEPFKCILVQYARIQDRELDMNSTEYQRDLQEQMKEYPFIDSIYALVEHSATYSSYDYVIRSDLDVFFTPAFAQWIPPNCAFITGNGAYSDTFNMQKLAHVANYSGIHFNASVQNIGSTWIGPPGLVAKVAERTVHWMVHLSKIEFSPKQRTSAWWGGAPLWMEWHYGVLLLYGGHLAVSEILQSGKQHPFSKLDLDHPTTSPANCTVDGPIHLHAYQNDDYFSKYMFKDRKYNESHPLPAFLNSSRCSDYAGYMASESLRMTSAELADRLRKAKVNANFVKNNN
ncbi:hypothetical protein RvY_03062 [Ramazzottius varieornatus]|uniref:DUF7164 domain-containing protein n=1 Tax=Ramazzottius varieornatus TaxID=947166 RepID=A0A1D1UQ86_RAMVA|nr:hypothetical protein RvY_03062 [Ramazzottius varieornatus]